MSGPYQYQHTGQQQYNQPYPASSGPAAHLLAILGSGRGNAAATGRHDDAGAGPGTGTGGVFIHEPAPHLASTSSHIQLQQPQSQSEAQPTSPYHPQASSHYPQHSPFLAHQSHVTSASQSPAQFGQYDSHPQPPRNSTPHTLVQQAFPPSAPFLAPSTLHAAAPPPPAFVVPASTVASRSPGVEAGAGYGGVGGVPGYTGAKPGVGGAGGGKMGLLGILNGKAASASPGSPHVSSGWNDGGAAYQQVGHANLGANHKVQAGSSGGGADIYSDAALAPSYSQSSHQHISPNGAAQAPMASTAATAAPPIPELELDISLDLDAEVEADSIFRDMTFEEVLEELNARFLVNLPREEMGLVRVYWQAEQAHWFYEDYLRPLNPHLPSLSQRQFSQLLIASSPIYPLLAANASASSAATDDAADAVDPAIISVGPSADSGKGQGKGGKGKAKGKKQQQQQQQQLQAQQQARGIDYDAVWGEYVAYKSMVPCCGGIILNEAGDKALMVRGYKSSAGWCFPRGKININEPELSCAIREVYEETGFDLTNYIKDGARDRIQTQINAQTVTMFIAMGVEEGTRFEARTKKEIGAIEWVPLVDLPTWSGRKQPKRNNVAANEGKAKRYYNVTPFVGPLKKWLIEHHIPINPKQRKNANPMSNGSNGVNGARAVFGSGMGSYASSDVPGLGLPGARDLQPFFGAAPAVPAVPASAHTGVGSGKDGMKVQSRTQPRQTQPQPSARNHVPGQTQGQGQGKGHGQEHGNGPVKPSTALDQLFGQFASISVAQAPTHVQHDLSTQRTAIAQLPAGTRPNGVNAGLDALFGSLGVSQRPAASHANEQSGRRHGANEAGGRQGEGADDGMDEMGEDALAQLLGSPVSSRGPLPMGMGGSFSSDGGARAAQGRASTGAQGGAGVRAKTEKQEKQEKLLALLGGARPGVASSSGIGMATHPSIEAKAAQARPNAVAVASGLAIPPSQPSHTSTAGQLERERQQVGQGGADTAIGEGKGMTRRQSNLLSMLSPPQSARSLSLTSGDLALGGLTDAVPTSTTQQGAGPGTQAMGSARMEYTGWDAGDGVSIDSADGVAGATAGVEVKRKQRQADLLASLAGLGGVSAPAPSAEGCIGSPIEFGSYASPPAQQGLLPRVPSYHYANNTQTSAPRSGHAPNQQHRLLSALQGPPASSASSQYQQATQHPHQYQSHPPFGIQPTSNQTGAQPPSGTGHAYHQYDTAAAAPGRQADFGYGYQEQHGRGALTGQGQGQGQQPDAHVNVLHPIPKAGASMGLLAMLNGK